MSSRSDSGLRSLSSAASAPRVLMPPRTLRTPAFPSGSGEKTTSCTSLASRNSLNSGRTSAGKDFILPKYANNRIPAKPGVRSSSLSLPQVDQHAGEEKKLPPSNLPTRVAEGRIVKPASHKSEVTYRPVGQRTSGGRRPLSLLICSSATGSCSHLSSSSPTSSGSSFRLRKGGLPAHSTLAKEAASVNSSIPFGCRERKSGSITSQPRRQESAVIGDEGGGDADQRTARKLPQSVAKVTPLPFTRRTCDVQDAAQVIRTNDGKKSSETQPLLNDILVEKEEKGVDNKGSVFSPDPATDGQKRTLATHLQREADHVSADNQCFKDPPSMESLGLMIASYKVKSKKLSEWLDHENGRRFSERIRCRELHSCDDSYSDTECSRRKTLTAGGRRSQHYAPFLRTSTLVPHFSAAGSRLQCPAVATAGHSTYCNNKRERGREQHVNNETFRFRMTDQSDIRHESQIKQLQLQLNSSKDRVCELTSKLIAKTEMLAVLENTLSNMNLRLQQLALVNHQKDMEINRMRAAAEVMQAYRAELERQDGAKAGTTTDVLSSPVRRLWLKSPFGKSLRGKILMSPKKTSPAIESEGRTNGCESIKNSNQSPSCSSANELTDKIRKTDSLLEKTRLEAISSAFHLENAKEIVKSLTEEIVLLRKQNQHLELEEKRKQSIAVTSGAFNTFLYC